MLRYLPLLLLMIACSDGPPTTPETRTVDDPNAGNTDLYDVDPDDPYEIGDGEFLGMRPGGKLSNFSEMLKPATVTFQGQRTVIHSIYGRNGEELGFVRRNPEDTLSIGEIVITSPDVVTEDGLRVGYTYADMIERIGAVKISELPDSSQVYATKDRLKYVLDAVSATAVDDAMVTQIVINP